jgi:hypothetical protein
MIYLYITGGIFSPRNFKLTRIFYNLIYRAIQSSAVRRTICRISFFSFRCTYTYTTLSVAVAPSAVPPKRSISENNNARTTLYLHVYIYIYISYSSCVSIDTHTHTLYMYIIYPTFRYNSSFTRKLTYITYVTHAHACTHAQTHTLITFCVYIFS